MKRKPIIAGNWKLHKDNSEAQQLANQIKIRCTDIDDVEVVLCPTYTALSVVHEVVKNSPVELGAQNVYWEESGAFTGEISAAMLKSCGVKWVIVGHSERRQYFGETDETVNKRARAALDAGLKPIICVGETLEQREANQTNSVVEEQLTGAMVGLTPEDLQNTVIAYEPVWAIGTGKTATPQQAQDVHAHLRTVIEKQFGAEAAEEIRIQYGGSVKPDNADSLLGQPDIDGALVGGACLKAETFLPIIQSAQK